MVSRQTVDRREGEQLTHLVKQQRGLLATYCSSNFHSCRTASQHRRVSSSNDVPVGYHNENEMYDMRKVGRSTNRYGKDAVECKTSYEYFKLQLRLQHDVRD